MLFTKDIYYFFISKDIEKFNNDSNVVNLKRTFELYGIDKEETFSIGNTFVNLLNSFDDISQILNECINLINKPFYRLKDYLSKSNNVDENILEIIYYELDLFYSKELRHIIDSQSDLKFYKRELIELENALKDDNMYNQYYDKFIEEEKNSIQNINYDELDEEDKKQLKFQIEYLKELEEEKENNKTTKKSIIDSIETTKQDLNKELKEQRTLDELPTLLKEYIENLIETITEYKNYFDLSSGVLDEKKYQKYDLDYYKILFSSKFMLPKSYIYNAFEKNNCIIPLQNLILELSKETEEKNINTLKNLALDFINSNNTVTCEIYEIHSLQDLLNIYMSLSIQKKVRINKCKNCGKYFIPKNRSDDVYCNNISPQNPNKTCKEYGAKKTYRDNLKSRPLKDEHNKTSQFFRMRIKRNQDKNNIKEVEKLEKQFNKYKLDYEKKLKQYNNKKLTEEDFKKWIIQQKDL